MILHAVRPRIVLRLSILLAATAAMVASFAAPARAHAIVTGTTPAIDETVRESPDRVVMEFSEPVEISFGAIRVYDTDADRVDVGETEHVDGRSDEIQVALEPDLPKGTYTVTWKVISADGHPISEAFVFHVIEPGENPQGIADQILGSGGGQGATHALFAAVRWVNFAALLVLCGGLVFLAAIWLRVLPEPRSVEIEQRFLKRARKLLGGAWIALLVATLMALVLQGAVAAEVSLFSAASPSTLSEVLATRFGVVGLVKIGTLVVLALVALSLWSATKTAASSVGAVADRPRIAGWQVVAGAVAITFLLASPGLAGHAGSTSPVALNVAADVSHLIAAASWIGGLVLLVVAAFPAVRGASDHDAAAIMAPVVRRFSDMAMVAVGVVLVTGIYRSWVEVGALRALTGAPYGWVLLGKIGVFLPLLALGAINNGWTKPRLERAARGEGDPRASIGALRKLVTVEVGLAIAVLGITSFLVNLPPARVDAGVTGPFVLDTELGDYRLDVIVDPNEVGENMVHLTATEAGGAPAPIKEMNVLFRMPEADIGPLPGAGKRLAPGHYVVQGRQLSLEGRWQIEVVARTGPFDDLRATFSVLVNR